MSNPRFCDLRPCAKATDEVNTDFPNEDALKAYRAEYLTPYTVGQEKASSYPVSW